MKIQRRHVALTVVTVVVGVFLILPTLYIIPLSFDASSTLGVPSGRWTTSWYVELFTDRAWARAARNSLQVAVLTTVLATVLGTVLALAFRVKSRINSIANAVTLAPMIVPAVILGVGLYGLLVSWGLGGTLLGLVIAHTVLAIPFVVVAVGSSLSQVDPDYEKAAASLGASPVRQHVRVVLPLALPGIAAGALFAFVTSWDEVVVSIFLTNAQSRTLPVLMWTQVRTEVTPTLAALGTCLLALSTLALLGMQMLNRRSKD